MFFDDFKGIEEFEYVYGTLSLNLSSITEKAASLNIYIYI